MATMKKLLFALPFLLLSACKGNTELSKTQIYSCEGMVMKNSVETPCLSANGKFTFNMALGENVELDYSNCASSLFNWREFKRKENTDLRMSYEYKFKTNQGLYVTQELNVDKVNGNFIFMSSKGSNEEPVTQDAEKSVHGSCKRVEKVIE
jgi:hypothetical protein